MSMRCERNLPTSILRAVPTVGAVLLLAHCLAMPLTAQEWPRALDSLLPRVSGGDAAARGRAEGLLRPLLHAPDQGAYHGPLAYRIADAALIVAAPITPPSGMPTTREMQWRRPAVRILLRALAEDSTDAEAAAKLEALTPYPFVWLSPAQELRQLRALGAAGGDMHGSLLKARIGLELEIGSADSAGTLLESPGATVLPRAAWYHLQAEAALLRGDSLAVDSNYYLGARAISTPEEMALYRRDIAWITTADEMAALGLDLGRPVPSDSLFRTFWAKKDLQDGRPSGSRVREQLLRWHEALRQYRWDLEGSAALAMTTGDVAGSDYNEKDETFPLDEAVAEIAYGNRLNPISRVLDDRGRLVMRLGLPLKQAASAGVPGTVGENLAWITPDGPTIVGFSRPAIKLKTNEQIVLMKYGMLARNYPLGDLMSVCNLDARLCALAGLKQNDRDLRTGGHLPTSQGVLAASNSIRVDYTRMREVAEHAEGYRESFPTGLNAVVEAYGIPKIGVLVVVAVPVRDLVPDEKELAASRGFATRVRVVVGDTARGEVLATLDTVRRWRSTAPVGKEAYLSAYLVVPARAGELSVSVVVGDTLHHAGTGQRFSAVPVARFDGKVLELSDPILGREGAGLVWHHDGETIPLNPTNAWRSTEPVTLWYQVDGMVPGHSYQTRYELWNSDGRPKSPKLVITATATTTSSQSNVRRELSVKEVGAGVYRLVIRVKDLATGQESVRVRRIAVRK